MSDQPAHIIGNQDPTPSANPQSNNGQPLHQPIATSASTQNGQSQQRAPSQGNGPRTRERTCSRSSRSATGLLNAQCPRPRPRRFAQRNGPTPAGVPVRSGRLAPSHDRRNKRQQLSQTENQIGCPPVLPQFCLPNNERTDRLGPGLFQSKALLGKNIEPFGSGKRRPPVGSHGSHVRQSCNRRHIPCILQSGPETFFSNDQPHSAS